MTIYIVGKLAPNSTHFTKVLIKYVPERCYCRAVPSQNGDKFAASPTPRMVQRLFFPCPRSRLRIRSRETGSAVPSRVSLLIPILRRNFVLTGFLPSSAAAS